MKTSRRRKTGPAPQAELTAPDRSDRERILWLLGFLRRDLAALRPGELLDLRNDVFPYLHSGDFATLTDFDADELRALGPIPPRHSNDASRKIIGAVRDLMAGLQGQLRAGIDTLLETGAWQPFRLDRPAPHWSLERCPDGSIRRSYMGRWSTITIASAADLVVRWWPQLRRCHNATCRAWFLPRHGRQQYHDTRCSNETRYQRFKPTRDYKTEYSRRYDSTRTSTPRRSSKKRK